jgi:ornithine cyclodeaminase/alanine dehydrogenase-like protein (mu-crystallin family)
MALFLTEADVLELFPMDRAIERVEASFRAWARGGALNRPRQRIFLPGLSLHYMAAAWVEEMLMGVKIYTVSRSGFRFLVLLYDAGSGEWLALIEADHLGRIRTGAASGVATKWLARAEVSRVAVLGSGRQARTQLEAVANVRKVSEAKVYSRDPVRRAEFAHEMASRLGIAVSVASSAEEAVRFAEVVITATNASEPILWGDWLRPGTHVNAIGANMPDRREVDDRALERAALVAVDSIEQAKIEAGDLIQGEAALRSGWEGVVELKEIVVGNKPGRKDDNEITLFKSTGLALWDVAAAGYVYRQAQERGLGREIDPESAGLV